ncbi:MAG: hypothetical protein SVR94_07195 [Pseudomonadota bacterium]|nr:hypothetical protein [Pseudomonadota bacterium]
MAGNRYLGYLDRFLPVDTQVAQELKNRNKDKISQPIKIHKKSSRVMKAKNNYLID